MINYNMFNTENITQFKNIETPFYFYPVFLFSTADCTDVMQFQPLPLLLPAAVVQ